MLRTRWCLILALLSTVFLLSLFRYSVTVAAPLRQASSPVQEDGQEYVVVRGDWLSRISQKFYRNTAGFQAIVDATNAKAATDPRFVVIVDPDKIEVGQLLWIPNLTAESESETATMDDMADEAMADDETISITVQTDGEAVSGTVRFVEPQDGGEVGLRFDVTMAAEGLTIEPAGEIHEGAGHLHILVDTDFIPADELLPFDENHIHFGQGQLTTTLELEPGTHVLNLQFANGAHIALDGEQYRDTITVTVAAPTGGISETTRVITETLPSVRFVEPQDGDEVESRFDVTMAAEGLTVEPAGEIHEGAGHLHILVDTDFIPADELLPFDENHIHFGRGQLTTTLELEPGTHVLNLQFANGAHIALDGEQYRDTITVTVDGN